MQNHHLVSMAGPGAVPALSLVNLTDVTAKELACLLVAPPSQVLVDCGGRLMPHPQGVCRFVTQLLQMRLRGTNIWLYNVHPGLRRCLHELKLGAMLHFTQGGLG